MSKAVKEGHWLLKKKLKRSKKKEKKSQEWIYLCDLVVKGQPEKVITDLVGIFLFFITEQS